MGLSANGLWLGLELVVC